MSKPLSECIEFLFRARFPNAITLFEAKRRKELRQNQYVAARQAGLMVDAAREKDDAASEAAILHESTKAQEYRTELQAMPPKRVMRLCGKEEERQWFEANGRPDWHFWLGFKELPLWQLCSLSLGLNPDRLHIKAPSESATIFSASNFPSAMKEAEFGKRLRLAVANRSSSPQYFKIGAVERMGLSNFATWAVTEMRWRLPPQLKALARTAPASVVGEIATAAREQQGSAAQGMVPQTKGKALQKWTDSKLRGLLDESREPGMTQEKLAQKYRVKRQRISALLKRAKDKLGQRRPTLGETGTRRIVKGKH